MLHAEFNACASSRIPSIFRWTPIGRSLVFMLSATSIWCLLADFYGVMSMRAFAIWILTPSTIALAALAVRDRFRGDRRLWRGVVIGSVAGLIAACAYDLFRLPFVFSRDWHLDGIVPPLKLFKVFPRFGAMLLGEPMEQPTYSLAAHLIGWLYHFSNGMTFGVMYMSLVGTATRRTWWWAVLFATGLEAAMLFSPYPKVFAIPLSVVFVIVTLSAHLTFGITMGLWARWNERAWAPIGS